jgi:RNA polymerase sigma-70 factor (ECF subfamily)
VLVRQARRGDRDAFAELLLRHRPSVERLCRRVLGDTWEADDVAQEASLHALLGIDRLVEPASFGPWLHAIAANIARKVIRGRRATPIGVVEDRHVGRIICSVPVPTPEDAYEAREVRDQIGGALSALSPAYRDAFIGYVVGGHTYAELARVLGVPVSTVRGRLFEGRRHLRARLDVPMSVVALEGGAMTTEDLIAVRIGDFVGRCFDRPDRLVLLYEDEGSRELALRLTAAQGDAVEAAMVGSTPPHPTTHDLLLRAVRAVGGRVERVVVDHLVDDAFNSRVELGGQGRRRGVDATVADGIALALLSGAPVFVDRSMFDRLSWDPSDPDQRRRQAQRHREEVEERVRRRRPNAERVPDPPSRKLAPPVAAKILEAMANVTSDLGAWTAILMDKEGAVLALSGDADAELARRYAAAKGRGDRDLMELYMLDLFPDDRVDAVMYAAIEEPESRLEVALPFGFEGDPRATSERIERAAQEIEHIFRAG